MFFFAGKKKPDTGPAAADFAAEQQMS